MEVPLELSPTQGMTGHPVPRQLPDLGAGAALVSGVMGTRGGSGSPPLGAVLIG